MRKLATAALAFSFAVFLANYILPAGWLIGAAALSAGLGAALLPLRRRWLKPAVIALLFFALGLAEFSVYRHLTVDRAPAYAGQTREIQGRLLDYPEDYGSYCRLHLRITSGDLPHFKAIAYDNHKAFADAEPGQVISFRAKITPADTIYGKPYDNYHTNGVFFKLSIKGEEAVLDPGFSFRSLPMRIHRFLCSRIEKIFPEDCRSFIKALMLGDKQDFYDDDALYIAMSRSGLMHVVAVSGLHVSFLVGILGFLLGHGRLGALTSIALIWCFVLITGSGNSAVRAGFMQTLLLLAPVLRRENDPITSLSAVLMLILAVCPFAAKSVSLQMSFAAMAGIICFGEKIYSWLLRPLQERFPVRPVRYILGVAASSLSVMVFTTPLTALHFGYVPLLAIVSNVACLWAVSLCFCMAWAACLLSVIPVIGTATGWLCAFPARYIFLCAGRIAALPYAVLYMQTEGALLWVLTSYALIPLGLILRRHKIVRIILPVSLSLALLAAVILGTEKRYRETDYMSVLNVGQGQCITAFAGDETVMIDCGNIYCLDDAGTVAGEYLLSRGRRSVGLLILTHLDEDHVDGAVRLMEMLPVKRLILPADTEENNEFSDAIMACAARHGTEVLPLADNADMDCGRIRLRLYKLASGKSRNERSLMASMRLGETELLVTADAPKKLERELVKQEDLSGTDILIVGHHGSKNASTPELLEEVSGRLAVISVGYNTYGHPAQQTLDALEEYGYTVKRTDVDGTMEFRLENSNGKETE